MDPSLNDAKEGKLVSTKPLDSEESPENSNENFCLDLNFVQDIFFISLINSIILNLFQLIIKK